MAHPQPSQPVCRSLNATQQNVTVYNQDIGNDKQLYYLMLEDIAQEDYGDYECEISNGVGNALNVKVALRPKGN